MYTHWYPGEQPCTFTYPGEQPCTLTYPPVYYDWWTGSPSWEQPVYSRRGKKKPKSSKLVSEQFRAIQLAAQYENVSVENKPTKGLDLWITFFINLRLHSALTSAAMLEEWETVQTNPSSTIAVAACLMKLECRHALLACSDCDSESAIARKACRDAYVWRACAGVYGDRNRLLERAWTDCLGWKPADGPPCEETLPGSLVLGSQMLQSYFRLMAMSPRSPSFPSNSNVLSLLTGRKKNRRQRPKKELCAHRVERPSWSILMPRCHPDPLFTKRVRGDVAYIEY
jgi:hypothetical protein